MTRKKNAINQIRRLEDIRKEVFDSAEVSTDKLARKFKVSAMTIRRDLEILESQGQVIRMHGGAALAKRLTFEFAFRDKQSKNHRQKKLIAQEAVRHIQNGQVIMLDTGTTTLQIAKELVGQRKVKVITTSLAIVSQLQFAPDIELILLGGFLRGGSPDLHGPLTEQNIEKFTADIAFIGADAIDENGNTYTDDLRVVNIDQKMAGRAKKVIVAADSQKLGQTAMCKIFSRDDYSLIISDVDADKKIVRQMERCKVNIKLV